ncbi:unnamed protein product [Lactuca saligna]|uniref:Uncharacterized protein n=1 Tax=Lactuca saligna TaxID=75948 RepID=A0AA36DWT5_LACSI|nr:unnamed protein product [Lactuca saligna]
MKAILRLLIFHRHCRFPAVIDDEFLRHRLYVISPKNSLDLKGWTLYWKLETGSDKGREDAAYVLWKLCCHSEDIYACVESAEAFPVFLWFLKTGGTKGQEASWKALRKLIRMEDAATINQQLALLWGDTPKSKAHKIEVLGHVFTMASHYDLVQKGSDAYKWLRSLVQILNSSNEETQEHLLTSNTQIIATQSARALGALSKNKISYIVEGDVKPLIKLAKTSSSIDAAETAVSALAKVKRLLLPTKLSGSINDGKKIAKTDDFT